MWDLRHDMEDLPLQGTGSLVAALSLQSTEASVVTAQGLSCSAACGILVPQLGIKPTSPALQGGSFTTGPPRKSHINAF